MTQIPPDPNDRPRRRDTLRYLLSPSEIKNTVTINKQPQPILINSMIAGVQVAITTLVAVTLVYFSPWPEMIGFASLGGLATLYGRFATRKARSTIVLSCGFWLFVGVAVISIAAWAGASMLVQLGLLSLLCGVFLFVTSSANFGPPGALIFVFAAGGSLTTSITGAQLLERMGITAAAAVLAWFIAKLGENWRREPSAQTPLPSEAKRPLRSLLIASARTTVGAAIAAYISYGLGGNYPAWAAMGALAVLQGQFLHINMHRALQRMVGTILGSLLAWAILSHDPSMIIVLLCVMCMQLMTEFVMGFNYGLAQIFITPMALLMTYLARPLQDGTLMVSERILDTILGAVVGILGSIILSSLDDRRYLAVLRDKQKS